MGVDVVAVPNVVSVQLLAVTKNFAKTMEIGAVFVLNAMSEPSKSVCHRGGGCRVGLGPSGMDTWVWADWSSDQRPMLSPAFIDAGIA